MLKSLLKKIIFFIGRFLNVDIHVTSKEEKKNLTAAKSIFGLWYAGDVFDSSDIAYGIFRNGLVEKQETELVIKILDTISKEGQQINFYDIGANSGYYGILAANNNPKTKVLSFEPLQQYTKLIRETSKINGMTERVNVFEIALGSSSAKAELQIAGSGSSFVIGFLGRDKLKHVCEVQIEKLDDIVFKESLPLPSFIKIDVECFELEVLKGAIDSIKNSLPVLFIEIISSLETVTGIFDNKNANAVFDFLTAMGYVPYATGDSKKTFY